MICFIGLIKSTTFSLASNLIGMGWAYPYYLDKKKKIQVSSAGDRKAKQLNRSCI